MRIIGNLIKVTLYKVLDVDCVELIEENISKLPKLAGFKFREVVKQINNDDYDQLEFEVPYLSGEKCTMILLNHRLVFGKTHDVLEEFIWDLVKIILLCWVESTDKFIEDKHGDLTELTELLLALSRCLTYRYAGVSLGWYMHMLIKHIEYLILQHKGLKKYCNEGSEALNALCMLIKDRSSNCGGGKGKVSLLEQILLLILRRLYIYVNSDWKDVAWIGASSESFSQLFEEDSDDTDIGRSTTKLL